MSDFNVLARKVDIEPHPNADAIEIARIDGYTAIVAKGDFKSGDVAVYIPEASIVPDSILEDMGLTGKLAGKDKNRVKAIRLRDVVSQGLVYKVANVEDGEDVTERLGITKYEPRVPSRMSGNVTAAFGKTIKFDIENIKKYPGVLQLGEDVVITEKIHGTLCQIGYSLDELIITSKGVGAKGLIFEDKPENDKNVYVQIARQYKPVLDRLRVAYHTFYVLGEIHGPGIQDLQYDLTEKQFRVFDVFVGDPSNGRYLEYDEMLRFTGGNFETVPLVYRGPWEGDLGLATGKSLIADHLREGVVIKPAKERRDGKLGRVILKAVSDKYLFREGNATEYE